MSDSRSAGGIDLCYCARRAVVALHRLAPRCEVTIPDQGQAEQAGDERDDRGDEQDFVETANDAVERGCADASTDSRGRGCDGTSVALNNGSGQLSCVRQMEAGQRAV